MLHVRVHLGTARFRPGPHHCQLGFITEQYAPVSSGTGTGLTYATRA